MKECVPRKKVLFGKVGFCCGDVSGPVMVSWNAARRRRKVVRGIEVKLPDRMLSCEVVFRLPPLLHRDVHTIEPARFNAVA
eukprot:2392544-Rhodomonas_salina.1